MISVADARGDALIDPGSCIESRAVASPHALYEAPNPANSFARALRAELRKMGLTELLIERTRWFIQHETREWQRYSQVSGRNKHQMTLSAQIDMALWIEGERRLSSYSSPQKVCMD
jgi:hypothetical protein